MIFGAIVSGENVSLIIMSFSGSGENTFNASLKWKDNNYSQERF